MQLGLLDDPFPLVLELAPLLRQPDELAAPVRQALEAVCEHSSAKEVVMALGMRMSQLVSADLGSDSDEGEKGTIEVRGETKGGAVEVGLAAAPSELVALVELYATSQSPAQHTRRAPSYAFDPNGVFPRLLTCLPRLPTRFHSARPDPGQAAELVPPLRRQLNPVRQRRPRRRRRVPAAPKPL